MINFVNNLEQSKMKLKKKERFPNSQSLNNLHSNSLSHYSAFKPGYKRHHVPLRLLDSDAEEDHLSSKHDYVTSNENKKSDATLMIDNEDKNTLVTGNQAESDLNLENDWEENGQDSASQNFELAKDKEGKINSLDETSSKWSWGQDTKVMKPHNTEETSLNLETVSSSSEEDGKWNKNERIELKEQKYDMNPGQPNNEDVFDYGYDNSLDQLNEEENFAGVDDDGDEI